MKLYHELAPHWQLISPTSDYKDEAAFFTELFLARGAKTVLELGAGGGNIAWYLKQHFAMTLTDISPDMLAQSEKQNPECEHIVGNMISLRLGKQFDAVFLHDASSYITSLHELERVIETCAVHTKQGGVTIIAPDVTREHFTSGVRDESHENTEAKVSYQEIVGPLKEDGITYDYDFDIVIVAGDKKVTHHDHHIAGVFSTDEWTSMLEKYGFDVQVVADPLSDNEDHERTSIFVAIKI